VYTLPFTVKWPNIHPVVLSPKERVLFSRVGYQPKSLCIDAMFSKSVDTQTSYYYVSPKVMLPTKTTPST
jgi:hypothetical protein